jgi:hypothetical protein
MGGKELMGGAKKGIGNIIDGIKTNKSISDAVLNGAAADDGTTEGINAALNGGDAAGTVAGDLGGSVGGAASGADQLAGGEFGSEFLGGGLAAGSIDSAGLFASGADTLDASLVGGVGADGLAIGVGEGLGGALATGEGAALADGLGGAAVEGGLFEGLGSWLAALFLSKGGMVQKPKGYKGGGQISGPGTATSDSVPVMASTGEYMLPAEVTQALGKQNLDDLVHMITGQKPVGAK